MAQLIGALSPAPEGCGFYPRSRHISRLQFWSLVRARMGGNQSLFLSYIAVSLYPSLSLSLSFSLFLPFLSLKTNEKISSDEDFKKTKNFNSTIIICSLTLWLASSNQLPKWWQKWYFVATGRYSWLLPSHPSSTASRTTKSILTSK